MTFLIPASVADAIFTPDTTFTSQQKDELRAASILWLKCNGYTFHFGKTIVYTESPGNLMLYKRYTTECVSATIGIEYRTSIVAALKSEYVGEPGLAEQISKECCQQEDTKDEKS